MDKARLSLFGVGAMLQNASMRQETLRVVGNISHVEAMIRPLSFGDRKQIICALGTRSVSHDIIHFSVTRLGDCETIVSHAV